MLVEGRDERSCVRRRTIKKLEQHFWGHISWNCCSQSLFIECYSQSLFIECYSQCLFIERYSQVIFAVAQGSIDFLNGPRLLKLLHSSNYRLTDLPGFVLFSVARCTLYGTVFRLKSSNGQKGPKGPKKGPKRPKKGPKRPKKGPKRPKRAQKGPEKAQKGGARNLFKTIQGLGEYYYSSNTMLLLQLRDQGKMQALIAGTVSSDLPSLSCTT